MEAQGKPPVAPAGVGRRIMVVGPSGSGKTTAAAAIGKRLGLPVIELDAINHLPNWQETPRGEFRSTVMRRLGEATGGWVCDGNYTTRVMDVVLQRADTIVWLRLPFRIVFTRLVRRTFRRAVRQEVLWNGNRERIWFTLFNPDSVVWYMARNWRSGTRRIEQVIAESNSRPRIIMLRSRRDLARLLSSLPAGQ